MQINLVKDNANESQKTGTKEAEKTANEAGKVAVTIADRPMNHIEDALLKNQKALAQTQDQMQNNYTTTLQNLLNNNANLMQRIIAMEMQLQGIQVRLAALNAGKPTVPE